MERYGPNTVATFSTDYPERPAHRGHTVRVDGWNDQVAMLLIGSDDRTNEALITVAQAERLLAAVREAVATS